MFARLVARVVLQAVCDARAQFAQPLQPTARAEWSRWTRNVPRAERAGLRGVVRARNSARFRTSDETGHVAHKRGWEVVGGWVGEGGWIACH